MFNHKISLIGCGNMGLAIVSGIIQSNLAPAERIYVYEPNAERLEVLARQHGFAKAHSAQDATQKGDIIILAVKPDVYPKVIEDIKSIICENQIVVSIAAGVSIEAMENSFGKPVKIVRTMPNTPALVQRGMTGMCNNQYCTQEDVVAVNRIFESFGKVIEIKEDWMGAFTGVSGSSPAYTFMFIEALADGGVLNGLPRDKALKAAAQAVLGAATLVLETGEHPGVLKDQVCSPGGTTIEAVMELEKRGFRGAVISAVQSCVDKFNRMSNRK